jgi:hypothetical protein
MPEFKFENIPIEPTKEEKPAKETEKEKTKEKADAKLEKTTKLINLKQGDEFLIPDSDTLYRVSVKYAKNRIAAREKETMNIINLDGDLEVIPTLIKGRKE